MRSVRYAVVTLVCLGSLWALWHESIFHVFWQFDHIEQHAKKVITGAQLQAWALNLIEQYPTAMTKDRPFVSDLGTNFPRQLVGLYHRPPAIQINKWDTNFPPYVFLQWGGGMIGHCGFEIGPTNFIGRGRAWQPGVYFWRESH